MLTTFEGPCLTAVSNGGGLPRLIGVGNGRGGGGKTTLTNSLAAIYAQGEMNGTPLRVVVVDLDAQASASSYLGARAVVNPLQAEPEVVHGIRLYRGGQALHSASVAEIAAHLRRASRDADIVLADLPPALAHTTHAALLAHPTARLLIVPQLEPGAVQPAQRLAAMARRRKVPFHVVGNRLDRRRSITGAVALSLDGLFPSEMLPVVLPDVSAAMSCILEKKPLPLHRPKAEISRTLSIIAQILLRGTP